MWWPVLLLPTAFALHTLEPPPPAPHSRSTPEQRWVDVRINHFQAHNNNTFPLRFYYNNEFGSDNIVIFVGGEWEISPGWLTGGLAYELASRLRASLFYTEHRYYGATRPSQDTNVSDLRYLTVDQALGDLAQFIQYIKSDRFQGGQLRDAKVGLVGCSYAGSMATWMRLAYPHLVEAAFSDSGPLQAQEDFPEYLEVVTEALRTQGGEECLASVESAMERMEQMLQTDAGVAQISDMFNTCTTLQYVPLDVATFFWFGITETFAYLVQDATPGDIRAACDVITDDTVADPVQRLATWVVAQPWNAPCIESRYTEMVAAHTDTSYDAPTATRRLWTYQTCVEFGWYQTTTSSRQPFLSSVPLEYFHQMCKDFFAPSFNEIFLRSGIERTNLLFGGLTHLPDYVVSAAGGHDPWSPMGPNVTHATYLSPVYVVPGVSHCQAIRPSGSSDIEELEATKQAVLRDMYQYVRRHIPDPGVSGAQGAPLATTALLILAVLGAV